jgi:hypothetical protein
MNVDILESNPDWRWYLLFGGGCLALTVIVWLVFKYGQVCRPVVQELPLAFANLNIGRGTGRQILWEVDSATT